MSKTEKTRRRNGVRPPVTERGRQMFRARVRTAIRRQLATDLQTVREMKDQIADLERHIDNERRRLAALDPATT